MSESFYLLPKVVDRKFKPITPYAECQEGIGARDMARSKLVKRWLLLAKNVRILND